MQPVSLPAPLELKQHRKSSKENRQTKKLSIGEKLNTSRLVHQPSKLKLCAVLLSQHKEKDLRAHFTGYEPNGLKSDNEDKKLLMGLFNWTEETSKAADFNLEVIIGDKFTTIDSVNEMSRAGNIETHKEADIQFTKQPGLFEQMLNSRYEAYKEKYQKKNSMSIEMCEKTPKTYEPNLPGNRDNTCMTQSAVFTHTSPAINLNLASSCVINNAQRLNSAWSSAIAVKQPKSQYAKISKLSTTTHNTSDDGQQNEGLGMLSSDYRDIINEIALNTIEENKFSR